MQTGGGRALFSYGATNDQALRKDVSPQTRDVARLRSGKASRHGRSSSGDKGLTGASQRCLGLLGPGLGVGLSLGEALPQRDVAARGWRLPICQLPRLLHYVTNSR